jgi:hypothetical protein
MSPKRSSITIVSPGSALPVAAFAGRPAADRLESLAAIWARQTGRPILVAGPRAASHP